MIIQSKYYRMNLWSYDLTKPELIFSHISMQKLEFKKKSVQKYHMESTHLR